MAVCDFYSFLNQRKPPGNAPVTEPLIFTNKKIDRGCTEAQWLPLSPHSEIDRRPFACSPLIGVGFLWVLQFPPTVKICTIS